MFECLHGVQEVIKAQGPKEAKEELPADVVAKIKTALEGINADDVKIQPDDSLRIACPTGIAYMGIYSGADMTVCIFLLRKGAVIPLHDHPGMWVYGRLLFGKMRVRSFDAEPPAAPVRSTEGGAEGDGSRGSSLLQWFGQKQAEAPAEAPAGAGGRFRARLRCDRILGPEPTTYSLSPEEGNLHELRAMESSAFFDILTPSYDPNSGRDCTYYRRETDIDDEGLCTLAPFEPWGFSMDTLDYTGPPWRG